MAIRRRLNFFLACALALALTGAGALPPAALWQCRHAVRVVGAAFPAPPPTPSAMPCAVNTAEMPMRGGAAMACCPAPPSAHRPARSSIAPPLCRPTLTRLATLALAGAAVPNTALRQLLAAAPEFTLPRAADLPPAPDTRTLGPRPPPTSSDPRVLPKHTPGLRAPPAA